MIAAPTREQVLAELRAYQRALLPGIANNNDDDAGARNQQLTDAMRGLHVNVEQVQREIFPWLASSEGLLKHATKYLGENPRKGATTSSGGTLRVYGTAGATVAAGDVLTHSDGTRYQLSEGGTIPASDPYQVDLEVESISTGVAANKTAGETLTFESPPSGITAQADLTADLSDAEDEETEAELLNRVMDAVRNPPAGGRFSDYRQWATAVVGVLSAHVYGPSSVAQTGRRGVGVVDVAVLRRGTGSGRIPSATVQQAVLDAIDAVRPATANDVAVLLPTAVTQDWDIKVEPQTGYGWDWTDAAAYTVASWTAGTRTLTWSAAVPAAVKAGHRLMVNGEVMVVESIAGSDTVLESTFASAPSGGEGIYPGGPLSKTVQQAIKDYHDTLGPARGTAADPEQLWDDQVRLAVAYKKIQAVSGVKDSVIVTPAANVVPNDNAPAGSVELLVANKITVRPK